MATAVYNNPEIKTDADKARQKFIDAGLQYSDITEAKFYLLLAILAEELEKFDGSFKMKISKRLKNDMPRIEVDENDKMTSAYIKVSSYYFDGREAISFNSNGWIGFAGWACSSNLIPFTKAFKKWVTRVKKWGK